MLIAFFHSHQTSRWRAVPSAPPMVLPRPDFVSNGKLTRFWWLIRLSRQA